MNAPGVPRGWWRAFRGGRIRHYIPGPPGMLIPLCPAHVRAEYFREDDLNLPKCKRCELRLAEWTVPS